ncbi:Hypothetical protein, putative [Bodo saltans]|uniref:Uncharacterized protein n=1 Tax=Bodo saltans TaxID=75058 RepID=A0A0S4J9F7_BODSA|nr:Hypothetical protein, putative [Bodo saltans]|eukprot:CUG76587.1 Hypothetical protein, putative [Bodo saltans]
MKRRTKSSSRAAAAKSAAAPQAPERKRGKSTGAIGRLVAQVQKTTMLKAKSDEAAIHKIEESIKHRFMEGAEYFDKDNLVAELITEHKGNFKRIDLQLTAQHTVATRKLHQLVYHHSNGFLNLFREVHKAHDLVDSLKKEVHSMKSIIAALSKVTFSAPGGLDPKARSQQNRFDDAQSVGGRRYRPSMMVDSGIIDRLLEVPSSTTQSLHCASYHLAALVVRAPSATVLSKEADEIVDISMLRDVAIEDVRQLIGTLELANASDSVRALELEAEARGLEPVVLQLEQELAVAATKQLTRLPVTIAYFDALHLPLLELLVQLKRPQQATEWLLTLHSQCIANELRHLQGTTDGNELCLVATDLVIALIKMTLRGLGRLGLPKDPNRPDAPFVNAQVILWVRREIESFGAGFLAQQILTTYRSNAGKGADQLAIITATLSECVACVRRIEDIGFPHADVHLIQSMRDPLSQLLTEIGRRTYKKQSSISQSMWNAVRLAVREDAKKFLGSGNITADDKAVDASVSKDAVAEITALNKLNMTQFDGLAPSSHLSLLQLMCFPSSSHAFQVTSSHRLTSDSIQEALKRGLQLDPYIWSKSSVVRKLLAEAAAAKQLTVIAAHLTSSPVTPIFRPMRLTLIETLASHKFSATSIKAALDQEAADRFQFLSYNSGGGSTSAASITPALLNELLTRQDIATPYWSRTVRDVFSDALETTIHQLLPAMKDVLHLLASHGGTNPVTQTQRKVMLSVLRNYRFSDADIPEEFVEKMDAKHLTWLFSSQCPLAHWSCSGPREYIGDIIEAIPQLAQAAPSWVQLLRSYDPVKEDLRLAIQQQVGPMILAACSIEVALHGRSSISLESAKSYLSQANVMAGQWPRVARIVFALALEKKYVGHSGFIKVAEVCKKLRDPIPIRVGVEDRKLVAVSLSSKGDDVHISSALSMVVDLSPEELDEQSAIACISSHHLTYLINKTSADIGIAYWSRATRDALADALERGNVQKSSPDAVEAIKALRESDLLTKRLSVDDRRKVRDQLKRKVESEPSASTREISKQQWTRFTPAMVQRFVLASGASSAAGAAGGGGSGADPTSGAANCWCDVVRRCIRNVLEGIMAHRNGLVEALRGPTRLAILKRDRVELSKLLEGHTFSAADIAKRVGSTSSSGSGAKQLLTKAMVSHDDFPVVLSTTVGPSPLFHTTASVLFALHSSAKDNTQSRMGAAITGSTNNTESLDVPPIPSAFLQDPCLAEILDKTCTNICLAMVDVLRREVNNLKIFCGHRMIQEAFQLIGQGVASDPTSPQLTTTSVSSSSKGISRHGLRDAPFVWVFHTLYAFYVDALALGVTASFAHSPYSVEQRIGEKSPLRVELLAQMQQETLAPFIAELAELLLRAAKEGPNCFARSSSSSSSAATDILTVRYNGGGNMPLTDVTAPSRMVGCIIPLESYCAWRVISTVPRYPHFDFGSVRKTDDEDYLFHYVVQVSLNLLSIYQEVLLGDFDDIAKATTHSHQQQQRNTADKLLRRLIPIDYSIMQSWVVQRGSGSNHIAALSLLQHLVVSTLRTMCSFTIKGNVFGGMYGDKVFSGPTADAKALRQTLVCFAAFYYFWVPLFSSERASSLFASGSLDAELTSSKKAAPPPPGKKGSADAALSSNSPNAQTTTTTSEVSRCNVDQTSAKASLANVLFPFGAQAEGGSVDILRAMLDECFSSTPALEKYAGALHTDTMKSKLSKLFVAVNLLQFAAKNNLGGDDDDDEEDEEEDEDEEEEEDVRPQRNSGAAAASSSSGGPKASVTMAHLHELLIHYVRLVS